MLPLADAAVCRSESDWLVGINGTRAMTAFNSKSGGFQMTTVGRVQTPTLAILVEREEKIRAFQSARLLGGARHVRREWRRIHGRWFDEQWRKTGEDRCARGAAVGGRRAQAIAAKCEGKPGEVTEETKPTTQVAPLLYDLTTLQREANARFGFSARTTLPLAQALYEKHKVLTYPRTDSRALPEDYIATVKATMEALAEATPYHAVCEAGAEGEMGAPQQTDLRQHEDLGPLRDHPDDGPPEAPQRSRGEALRLRRQALRRGVLSPGRVHGDDAHHARRGRAVQDRGQGARRAGLARRLRQGGAGEEGAPARRNPTTRPPSRRSSPARRCAP